MEDQHTRWVSRVGQLNESQFDIAYDSVFARESLDDVTYWESYMILHFDDSSSA